MFPGSRDWLWRMLARMPAALPSSCALCGCAGDEALCGGCHAQFFSRRRRRCLQCASPMPDIEASQARVCGECMKNPPAFDATVVVADYAPPVDQLVLGLKFGNRLAMAPLFARLLHVATTDRELALPDRLVAVPLGPARLAERGFNQALEIARPLARALGVTLDTGLAARRRDTQAQAMLHPDERRKNIRHAFIVPAAAIDRVGGRHIGVVDDVLTTGETLNELAATLKRFGARRVTNFVFARTAQK
jgi:ComF family protein